MPGIQMPYTLTSTHADHHADGLRDGLSRTHRAAVNSPGADVSPVDGIIASWDSLFSASGLTSGGNATIVTIQQPAIEKNKIVCDFALDCVAKLPASHHKNLARSMLISIRNYIMDERLYAELTPFHPISFSVDDDGTIVLEWAYRNGRISYYIDPELEDSVAVFVNALAEDGRPKTWSVPVSADGTARLAADSVRFVSRLA